MAMRPTFLSDLETWKCIMVFPSDHLKLSASRNSISYIELFEPGGTVWDEGLDFEERQTWLELHCER